MMIQLALNFLPYSQSSDRGYASSYASALRIDVHAAPFK
jgi:hypothetical protein